MNIVVGITGGIAAYKAVGVVRSLVLAGHDVHVVPTEAALRFVGRPTLEALSRNPVSADLYDDVAAVRHVALGQAADLIVIAPATAASLARLATGLSDDLLGTTVLASTAPLVVAPAMHTEMWLNPATQANVETLRARGVTVVGPASGQLTGADSGPGRMAEPDEIVAAALAVVGHSGSLAGRRVVVTAGGTREPLDPVRFLGNRSSGRQGVELARAARDQGAEVVLVAAHLEVSAPSGVEVTRVETAAQLQEAVTTASADADLVIMAAAVADYRPAEVSEQKIKKRSADDGLVLELVQNPDVLAGLVAARATDDATVIVGFAAETAPDRDTLLSLAREKLARKGCDFIVANRVGWDEVFGRETTEIVLLSRAGDIVVEASGSKASVADAIIEALAGSLPRHTH
ncbi:bifunctional phosphopantothenoylcysteine decarboxylase/phosphopantothenate--cysteine ligase CoaBC [Cnuibacter sp. UC19_7]|uniref:bifunctional phosphopantothenoylcysteine decarboxylase/phosphopantothenate--cysteine ligase CoaBC n=1 Tax=Cnuibacter sp. UC19_7 TaxID=3350166 RepID=UPI0036715825